MGDGFGQRIREARKDAGLTAEQIAPMLGVTMGTVLRWERNEIKRLSYDQLVSIARVTGKPLSYFTEKAAA